MSHPALGLPGEEENPERSRHNKDRHELFLHNDGDRASDEKDRPGRNVPSESLLSQVPTGFENKRHHDRSNSIEESSELPVRGKSNIETSCGDDEDERRKREGDGDEQAAEDSEAYVAAVDGKLIGERAWTSRRYREPAVILFFREPTAGFRQVAPHVISEALSPTECPLAPFDPEIVELDD